MQDWSCGRYAGTNEGEKKHFTHKDTLLFQEIRLTRLMVTRSKAVQTIETSNPVDIEYRACMHLYKSVHRKGFKEI